MKTDHLITFDAGNCDPARVGEKLGISTSDIDGYAGHFSKALDQIKRWDSDGTYGFLSLPNETSAADEAVEIVRTAPQGVDTFLHLGIGGSSLGTIAIQNALDNPLTPKHPAPFKRIVIHENVDPEGFALHAGGIDFERTLVNVVSKSGDTIETLALLTAVLDKMNKVLSQRRIAERLIVSTENTEGVLHKLAVRYGARVVALPHNVGGRFSVLTAVGLLPAAAMGLDPYELLTGAADMRNACFAADSPHDHCFLSALIPYLLARRGVNIHVLFPYSDLLGGFALWCRQLLAESLGKKTNRRGEVVHVGQTPMASIGTVDQHSLLQLYVDGPADKLFTFFEIERFRADEPLDDLPHPKLEPAHKHGLTLAKLLNAELRGTADSLASEGRPSATIRIPQISAHSLGQLFYFFELSTAYAAELYDIDAFDQPGVEASKKLIMRHIRGEA
jgi:glucose-6-phosphate isomerase